MSVKKMQRNNVRFVGCKGEAKCSSRMAAGLRPISLILILRLAMGSAHSVPMTHTARLNSGAMSSVWLLILVTTDMARTKEDPDRVMLR